MSPVDAPQRDAADQDAAADGETSRPAATTSRATVRAMFREEIPYELDQFSLPDAAASIDQRIRSDPTLLKQFLDEHLYKMIYEVGMSLVVSEKANDQRMKEALAMLKHVTSTVRDPTGPGPATVGQLYGGSLAPIPLKHAFKWLKEPVLIARRHYVRLEVATRPNLQAAIKLMDNRVRPQRVRLAWFRLMEAALADNGQTIGGRFNAVELVELRQQALREVRIQDEAAAMVASRVASHRLADPTDQDQDDTV